ncbi:MAG TPA: 4-hydroxy-3-methylbut-2-enyl diphosphate reductase [Candidatus Polarisedimenticolia bacterium]|nr:4-hydroxy-3-methylbut-2-enyl diphosphate reductase [Candidatus Polarisedimenticolia bacterium]
MPESPYYQRGFGLKPAIEGTLRRDYHSALVDRLRAEGSRLERAGMTIRLAEEFGFCYGVDRAVEYAYETVEKFPDRRVFLVGEIIHNPRVNDRIRGMGIVMLSREEILAQTEGGPGPADVVILPAFGVPVPILEALRGTGCILVDTTCGSVLNVWKNVERYARDGFTSVIHGKYEHEETRATASRARMHPGGQYLIVKDMEQAETVCRYIEQGGGPGARGAFLKTFGRASSPGFDPDLHLGRIGVANQTTMLSSESLAIADRLRVSLERRFGPGARERFRAFDTICSATQERQDAVIKLAREGVDLMIIIGGYNSSNTNHLSSIGGRTAPTYHINSADCILGPGAIRHKPYGSASEVVSPGWLPEGSVTIGVTAGASTPNVMIGEVVAALLRCRGEEIAAP